MKNVFTITITLFLLSLNIAISQNQQMLVKIDFLENNTFKILQNNNIPIYHIFSNAIIAGVSAEKIRLLKEEKLNYSILDRDISNFNYYLISSKPGKPTTFPKIYQNNILYQDADAILIKSNELDTDFFKGAGYNVVKLLNNPINIPNYSLSKNIEISPLDSLINSIIQEINPDSIRMFIQSLQDFGTRYAFASNRDTVSSWIYHQFKKMGYEDVRFDTFYYSGTTQRNVVATLYGSVNPSQVYVIGGHHDSYSSVNPMYTAPGADDNASGTATALEIARVLKRKNFIPEVTIQFITFAAEELGLIGSNSYASKAQQNGMNIKLMMNHDMIGYLNTAQLDRDFLINQYTGSEYFANVMFNIAKKYTTLNPVRGSTNSASSDSYSFWRYGFPSVYLAERDFSPVYHSPNDLINLLNMDYIAEIMRVTSATFLTLSVVPEEVKNIYALDRGDGKSLYVGWSPNIDTDLSGYKVYVGKFSGVYDSSYFTDTNSYILTNLEEGRKYYIGVTSVDNNGYESFVREITATPQSIPREPKNVIALSKWHNVELHWALNSELDILGYNVYKASDINNDYVKVNTQILTDRYFIDSNTVSDNYYYYKITAVDQDLNESNYSQVVRSRAVSLAYGILVVDETYDSSGILMYPDDFQVDEFYNNLLYGFNFKQYDIAKEKSINLADLGAYSTVIWHGNDFIDYSIPQNSQNILKEYLNYGGKLLITSYSPTKSFGKNYSYPKDFLPGDFIYDYFKIRRVEQKPLTRFIGAKSIVDYYPSIYVDTTKTLDIYNFHLINIEAIYATETATETFEYDTYYDSTSLIGSLKNKPVAIEYMGTDYKLVLLGFPLYYMNFDSAQEMIRYVLVEKFDEILNIYEYNKVPEKLYLSDAYPNPFNSQTTIKYELSEKSFVSLKIYNLLGQEIATLVEQEQNPGFYEVKWNGKNQNNNYISSGIYIYRLTSAGKALSKKVILIK